MQAMLRLVRWLTRAPSTVIIGHSYAQLRISMYQRDMLIRHDRASAEALITQVYAQRSVRCPGPRRGRGERAGQLAAVSGRMPSSASPSRSFSTSRS
jgi:hypothetical protein